jgi:hypothetical protein
MAQVSAFPKAGDVKPCSECGQMTAVYERVSNSLFVSPAQAAYPGRLPDIYAGRARTAATRIASRR